MSNQVPPGPGPTGSEPPYGPYSSQVPGVPPPPGPYQPRPYSSGGPTGAPPPSYGQGSYGAPQPYGPPPEQPSYGYSPEQPGYGAPAPGYQPGGQYQPGGYAPYAGDPYPGAPKGGSGTKIVAIVAAAVVVVGLVVGGAIFLTRSKGDNQAGSSTSAASTTSHTPSPRPTRSTAGPTGSTWSTDQARAVATAAAPGIGARDCSPSSDGGLFIEADVDIFCSGSYGIVNVYVWGDTTSAFQAVRHATNGGTKQEVSWEHGTDFISDASPNYYDVVRCYADAPVCIEAWEDTQSQAETVLNTVGTLDDAGIAALNSELAART